MVLEVRKKKKTSLDEQESEVTNDCQPLAIECGP